MKIRVLHVISRMNLGGPAIEITELCNGLSRNDFDQQVVAGTCSDSEQNFAFWNKDAPPIYPIRGLGRRIRIFGELIALYDLIRAMRKFRPHVVHTHTVKAGVLGRLAVRLARVNCTTVHTFHGHLLYGYFGSTASRAVVFVERTLAKRTDCLIAVGERVSEELLQAHVGQREQYEVIYSGLSFVPALRNPEAKQILGFSSDDIIVVYVGRLTKIKCPDRLLDVAGEISKREPAFRFLVVGGGELATRIQARIQLERLPVQMLGWRADINSILAAADIAICTSDNEGVPISLIEAGFAGIPAVATDVGSVREVIESNKTGFVVEPIVESLVEALLRLKSRELREKMGQNARRHVESRFSLDAFTSAHADIYMNRKVHTA